VPSEIRSMAAGVQAMTKQRLGGTPDKGLRLHAGVGRNERHEFEMRLPAPEVAGHFHRSSGTFVAGAEC
jgi:hypothetical protein